MIKEQNIQIRDTDTYNKIINEIGEILEREKYTFVEAYGILKCVETTLTEIENEK